MPLKNQLITASAGTGKTQSLVDLIIDLISRNNARMRSILAITFTEKASNEMRERLEKQLRFLIKNQTQESSKLELALREIDKSQICTIHSLCAHILRLYPVEGCLSAGFKIDQGDKFDKVFEDEWARFLQIELEPTSLNADNWRSILQEIDLEDIKELAKKLSSFLIPLGLFKMQWVLDELDERTLNFLKDILDKDSLTKEQRSRALITSSILKDEPRVILKSIAYHDLLPKLATILSRLVIKVRNEFIRSGYINFDGLLILTRNLLRDDRVIRERLKKRYKFILVDEFQDTDPIQYEMIFYLAEREGVFSKDISRVQLDDGKLFVVADPKQSIYSFRGADILAYKKVTGHLGRLADVKSLSINYRSRSNIIEVVNFIFSRLFKSTELQPDYERLNPSKTDQEGEVRVVLFKPKEGEYTAEESRAAEAAYIARYIKAMIKEGESASDFCILMRTMTQVEPYLDALRHHSISFTVEGERYFYQTQEVIDLCNLLKVIDDPEDEIAVVGFLRSCLGGFSDEQIYQLKEINRLNYMNNTGDELFNQLRELHRMRNRLPIDEFIKEVYSRLQVFLIAPCAYHPVQSIANVVKLIHIAREKSRDLSITFSDFVKFLDENIKSGGQESEGATADETIDAVRIMTIHKSKGLEFPIVIIPNIHGIGQSGQPSNEAYYDWSSNSFGFKIAGALNPDAIRIEKIMRKKAENEIVRLLYVAMTRAKDAVLLTGAYKQRGYRKESFMGLIKAAIGKAQAGKIQACNGHLTLDIVEATEDVESICEQPEPIKIDTQELASVLKKRKEQYDNPSALFIYPSNIDNAQEELLFSEHDHEEVSTSAALIGKAVHDILRWIDFSWPVDKILEFAREFCDKFIKDEVVNIIRSFADSEPYSEIKDSKVISREVPFIKKTDKGYVSGVIDIVYQSENETIIADYKTDNVHEAGLATHAQKYSNQKIHYKEAVEDALSIKDATFKLIFVRLGKSFILS